MMKIVETDDKTYVYKALAIAPPCLKCHADASKMDKKILNEIDERYPHDKAKGFALGDFRGAMVVEIEK